MKRFILPVFLLLFFTLFLFTGTVNAQAPPPTPEEIPFDGGIGFLIVAGLIYGARKLYLSEKDEEVL